MPSAPAGLHRQRRRTAVYLLVSASFAALASAVPGSIAAAESSPGHAKAAERTPRSERLVERGDSRFWRKSMPRRHAAVEVARSGRADSANSNRIRSGRAAHSPSSLRLRLLRPRQYLGTSEETAGPTRPNARRRSLSELSDGFGISAGGHTQNLGAAELTRELDHYRSLGARWMRIGINWHVIQRSGPDSFNWAPFDAVVRGARERGINVLGVLLYTPPWARGGRGDPATPPSDPGDYATFAAQAVRHYAPMGVEHWEIWNEPNIPEFWKTGPNAAAYTALLRAAYGAIKRADPDAAVVSGGLSGYGAYRDVSADGRINPLTFLERMYAAGANDHFDALGYHPYNFPGGLAFHPASGWSQMVETRPSVRSIMNANRDGDKQIWATEFGAPTSGAPGAMTEREVARLVTDGYKAFASYSWAGPLFWYSLRDLGASGGDREYFFGLLRHDFSAKPAYTAYQQAAAAHR
jgi:polysaccharide biosynthesis protein PslG